MRNRWCFGFGKKNAKKPNPAANHIENPPASETPIQPVAPYNVVFIDTEYGSLATQLVNIYTRRNAWIMDDGWLCGTVPHLDGATFYAPPNGKFDYENVKTFLSKLREPVRLMVCTPYGERFLGEKHNEMFMRLKHIFTALNKVEIVLIGGPPWRGSGGQLLAEVFHYGGGVAHSVNRMIGDNSLPISYWWGGGTQDYYNALPVEGRNAVSSEVSNMLNSLSDNHGVILDARHITDTMPLRLNYNF